MPPSEIGGALALLYLSEVATGTVKVACLPVSHDASL